MNAKKVNRPVKPTGERLTEYHRGLITLEHLHRYALACQLAADKSVLDLACGEGYGSQLLANVARAVTGADIDKETITAARQKYNQANLNFVTCTATDLPFADNSFDLVVSFETLEHLEEHSKMLAEIKRVLRPAGIVLISTPDKKNYSDKTGYRNPYHLKELYRSEFQHLLTEFFKNTKLYNQYSGLYSVCCSEHSNGSPLVYNGTIEKLAAPESGSSPYIIALASDSDLTVLPTNLFEESGLLQQLLLDHANDVRRTMSYRLGHFLLSPAKWIYSFFRTKENG